MQDVIRLVLSYLVGIWRYRWMVVMVPALISPVGWFYVATLPDVYAADAKVFVDTDSVLKPLLQGLAVRIDDHRRITMMTKLLFSREIMEKLARMTDQDLRAKTPQDMERLTEDLKERIKLTGLGGNIYTLSFDDESSDLAKRVVQSFLTIFVETNLGESRKDQDTAEQFLLREVKEYERRLNQSERRLKEFKSRNLAYISDKGDYFEELQDMKSKLETVRLEYQMTKERRDELQEQLLDFQSQDFAMLDGNVQNPLEARIGELNVQIDEYLVRYTERHPEIISLRRTVDRLQQRMKEMEDQTAPSEEKMFDPEQSFASNPVYQQLKLLVSEAEAEVAGRQTIFREYERRIEHLKSEVDRVLEVETESRQLNRDYGIIAGKHNSLMERLEQLRLGRQVDSSAETVRFRVIEPPKVSDKPVGPNRILFSAMAFGGSLAVGLGLALVISLFRPTFSNRNQLNDATGIPVLGSVDMIWTDTQRRTTHLYNLVYAASFGLLLLSFGLVIAVYQLDINILSRLSNW